MGSTFSGLELVRTGLVASQTALDITGQNIANVNTEGYSRQRVDQSALAAISGNYQYAATISSKVGQGVVITGFSRIRDTLIDIRYRKENSELSEQVTIDGALSDLENIFDETTVDGLNAQFADFFDSLSSLADSPESVEIATTFRAAAQTITSTFNSYASLMSEIKDNILADMEVNVNDINNIALKLQDINAQIQYESLTGNPANELLDQRDSLLDELSSYSNITVEAQNNGSYAVKMGSEYLITTANQVRTLDLNTSGSEVSVIWTDTNAALDSSKGMIKANLDFLNGKGTYATGTENAFKGLGYYQAALDSLASSFATQFNTLNADGATLKPLFTGTTAATINISAAWQSNAQYVTTALTGEEGDNGNVMRMMKLMETPLAISPTFTGTFEEYSTSLIGELAVQKSYYDDISEASSSVVSALQQQRESVMGVSLDEEAVNMIKYEKAYNAAARIMTAIDQMLETLINGTGIVGRA